jgi:two-component sensor histidine kinase
MRRVFHTRLYDMGQLTEVRHAVAKRLELVGVADHPHAVKLVLSELVTNAFMHGRPPYVVTVSINHEITRVAVEDSSSEFPSRRAPHPPDTGGFGLNLVDAAARAWGVTARRANGKIVWADIEHSFSLALPYLSVDA